MSATNELMTAIADAAAEVAPIAKDHLNKYDGYQFVSIDDYMVACRKSLAKHKLVITATESDVDIISKAGRKGEAQWLKFRWEFRVHHGPSGQASEPYIRTVFVPWTGAQASGSAQSYAIKVFYRQLLNIPTGECDDPDFPDSQGPISEQAYRQQQAVPPAKKAEKARVDQAVKEIMSREVPNVPPPPRPEQNPDSGAEISADSGSASEATMGLLEEFWYDPFEGKRDSFICWIRHCTGMEYDDLSELKANKVMRFLLENRDPQQWTGAQRKWYDACMDYNGNEA